MKRRSLLARPLGRRSRDWWNALGGLPFNDCRTPLGASDDALERHTLDEAPGHDAIAGG